MQCELPPHRSELRGVVYARRSTAGQECSLESQLEVAIENAKVHGIPLDVTFAHLETALREYRCNVGDLYIDTKTGADPERPGPNALLSRAASSNRPTHIFTWVRNRLSRASRGTAALATEQALTDAGISIVLHDGKVIGPTDEEDDEDQERQGFDEYRESSRYRRNLAFNALRAQSQNARRGVRNGGEPTDGFVRYAYDPGTGKHWFLGKDGLVKRPVRVIHLPGQDEWSQERLELVREIADLYHEDFGGLKAIANELTRRGIPVPHDGRTRKGVPVSTRWTPGQVRSILEQPVYCGLVAWGRTAQGDVMRYDPSKPSGSRKALKSERIRDGLGRRRVFRSIKEWTLVEAPVPYEPIVPRDIWRSNVEKLAARGRKGGQRGVPRKRGRASREALKVICADCGHRMSRCPGREPLYKCSTYMNQGREACNHNWIERRTAQAFAVEGALQVMHEVAQQERLAVALREALAEEAAQATAPLDEVRNLEKELGRLVQMRRAALKDKYDYDAPPSVREDAEALHRQFDEKARAVQVRLQAARLAAKGERRDIEAEVAACREVLEHLSTSLHLVPQDELHATLNALGVAVVVEFERRKVGRRDIVPKAATVHLGGLPEAESPGELTSYSKDGRGERIRTSDLCNPIAAR